MRNTILLSSFVSKNELYIAIDKISSMCKIEKNNIFVFVNENNPNEYILTYNIPSELANLKFESIWKNTIAIHRKKQTNTLYSINAMNELIKSKNNGIVNPNYSVNWEDYKNKMLLIQNGRLKEIKTRLVKINQ